MEFNLLENMFRKWYILFCFDDDGKPDIYYILKIRYPFIKQFIGYFYWMHWNELETSDENGLCVSMLLNNIRP